MTLKVRLFKRSSFNDCYAIFMQDYGTNQRVNAEIVYISMVAEAHEYQYNADAFETRDGRNSSMVFIKIKSIFIYLKIFVENHRTLCYTINQVCITCS